MYIYLNGKSYEDLSWIRIGLGRLFFEFRAMRPERVILQKGELGVLRQFRSEIVEKLRPEDYKAFRLLQIQGIDRLIAGLESGEPQTLETSWTPPDEPGFHLWWGNPPKKQSDDVKSGVTLAEMEDVWKKTVGD